MLRNKDIIQNEKIKGFYIFSKRLQGLWPQHIDKLEECLKVVGCDDIMLTLMVITLVLDVDYIILLARMSDNIDIQKYQL